MALLSRQPNALNPWQFFAAANITHQFVDGLFENGRITKCSQIDHQNGLSGVGGRDMVGIEINHITTHCCAAQSASKHAHNKGQSIALVITNRQQEPLVRTVWICQWLALSVNHPTHWHLFPALGFGLDFAIGGHGCCHVQNNRWFFSARNGCRNWIGRQQHVRTTPRG